MTLDAQPVLFIFPGQGSQYPGMGKDLFDAFSCVRDVYAEASDVLGYDIAALSFDDPKDQIHLTRFTQPALLTHSIACLNVFQEQLSAQIIPRATAGHSLGEYSALVASGALDFASALQLVNERGRLMGELGEGEMEALPLEFQAAKNIAEQHYCAVAACNLPDQTVVGGRAEDLDSLIEQFGIDFPGKRSARLKTEGAFHTFYMIETAMQFRSNLATAPFQSPAVSVLSNASGTFHTKDPDAIRAALFIQLFSPVLWNANLNQAVENGGQTIIEFGGGIGKGQSPAEKKPNLAGIVKKTFRRHDHPPQYSGVINIDTLEKSIALCTT